MKKSPLVLIIVLCWAFSANGRALSSPQPIDSKLTGQTADIIQQLGKWALLRWSQKRLENVADLNELQKEHYLRTDSRCGVAIIIYEFATGTGPAVRYLDERTKFAQDMVQGPAIEYLTKLYLSDVPDRSSAHTMCYLFSPELKHPSTWPFAIKQHFLTLKGRHLSQFILGGFYACFEPAPNRHLRVHIWNVTSKKSYFLHIGRRVQRPLPFGNVTQHVFLDLSPAEQIDILTR